MSWFDDDDDDGCFESPAVPTVEYAAPVVDPLYGPDGEVLRWVEYRPFPFGFARSA